MNEKGTKVVWKEEFVNRYSKLTNWEVFSKISLEFLRKCIRANTLKINVKELCERLKHDWTLEQVPWCKEGFFIKHKAGRLDVGNTVEHILGYYYVQEAASMIPPIVLDPQPGEAVLDACAAPGSKTSQIAQLMNNKGILVANDVQGSRLAPLGMNLQRMGVSNCVITLSRGERLKGEFDRILVDAPCSGTGTIRKSLKTVEMWNPHMVRRLSIMQKKILSNAFGLLKKGGTLVYSTCSLEPEENEGVISWFLERHENAKVMPIKLSIKRSLPVMEFEGTKFKDEVKECLRIWPQDNDTEGFFVCKIQKI